ncbi:ribonuclease HII [Anderseniella sp. Alg231-50]|uniref:ribonuclease HII n=1 Tax=Anderseniella sp. Alg231-50 TaxID=1922226 RepID=UPI000D550662
MAIRSAIQPDFILERAALDGGARHVAGVDEAGRGPLAGPVVAAAVILNPGHVPDGLNDSKKLSEPARDALFAEILATADIGVGVADVARIDEMNILWATMWAMSEAIGDLEQQPDLALIDGNRCPKLDCRADAIVKGDAKSMSIAAASIVAKVTRDRIMATLDRQLPEYGFARHKGYGTAFHLEMLKAHGATPHHRNSFAPVRKVLATAAR